ncbi:hypothetical protein D5S17_12285 [Pseudonocardiaceae bacterium YIM PH 21723]|nr:hypothetical protein D5S17_12285 [Pseudonocardiaceae bacterium YIM PH 21723]
MDSPAGLSAARFLAGVAVIVGLAYRSLFVFFGGAPLSGATLYLLGATTTVWRLVDIAAAAALLVLALALCWTRLGAVPIGRMAGLLVAVLLVASTQVWLVTTALLSAELPADMGFWNSALKLGSFLVGEPFLLAAAGYLAYDWWTGARSRVPAPVTEIDLFRPAEEHAA